MTRKRTMADGTSLRGDALYKALWLRALMDNGWTSERMESRHAVNLRQSLNGWRRDKAPPSILMELEKRDYKVKKIPHRCNPGDPVILKIESFTNIPQDVGDLDEIAEYERALEEKLEGRSDGATHEEAARRAATAALAEGPKQHRELSLAPAEGRRPTYDQDERPDADPDATPVRTSADIFAQAVAAKGRGPASEDGDM